MAMREEVYEILPFILDISNDTFESQKLTKLSMLPGNNVKLIHRSGNIHHSVFLSSVLLSQMDGQS